MIDRITVVRFLSASLGLLNIWGAVLAARGGQWGVAAIFSAVAGFFGWNAIRSRRPGP